MLRVYIMIIVVGLVGGVVYGGYYYYQDTQQRLKTLQQNNAKLEVAVKLSLIHISEPTRQRLI